MSEETDAKGAARTFWTAGLSRSLFGLSRIERRDRLSEALAGLPAALAAAAAEALSDVALGETSLEGRADWAERAVSALRAPRIGDPARAARTLASALSGGDPSLSGPGCIEALIELSGASAWAARILAARPGLVGELCEGDASIAAGRVPESAADAYTAWVQAIVRRAGGDTAAFDAELRLLRNREALRIALAELRGADVRGTAADLADLASAALQGALDHHLPKLVESYGPLHPPCRHLVVGLGKLGGRELNFSSDIDVIYLYEHDEALAGDLSSHQLHVRLFERVTNSLSKVTEHGRVFRVDIDLRPEGRTGPLCNSLAGLERYYETWGRTWERAAWIKGRPVAGDLDLFSELERIIRPFVFRRSRDLAAVEGVLDMKAQIDLQRKRPRGSYDLKLGKGGIREIEFFAQGQQLLFGGRDPRLQRAGTLDALHALEVAGRLNPRDREVLGDAYLFLRRVEHRVQLVEDRQTHEIPKGEALEPLARSLGFEQGEDLERALRRHTQMVHRLFTGLLGAVNDHPAPPREVELLLDPGVDDETKHETLHALGSRSPHMALANLATSARIPRSPLHPAASERHARLGRQILAECLASSDLDRALKHLPDLLRSLIYHGAYVDQLERSDLRRGVARVLGASDLLARILVSSPALLPGVLFAGRLPATDSLLETIDEGVDLADVEGTLIRLRQLKVEELLRCAMADLAGAVSPPEVQARLTELAERLIGATLRLALGEAEARYGPPRDPDAALVILAGGTLGAKELGYRSDVDLSAIYVGEGETAGGARSPVSLAELYTRVVQRMLSFLSLRMPQGDLYPVDMRLRPSGSQGALVASLSNFETYHVEGRARLWERQALIRTRVIAGPPRLKERVEAAVHRAAYGRPYARQDAIEIHHMRERMERERSRPRRLRSAMFHVKLGTGGLVEAEFLVQHLLMLHVPEAPGLATASTREALFELGRRGHLSTRLSERLVLAHQRLRRVIDWLRVIHDEPLETVDLEGRHLRRLALVLGYQGGEAEELLRRDIESDRRAVHEAYRTMLGIKGEP